MSKAVSCQFKSCHRIDSIAFFCNYTNAYTIQRCKARVMHNATLIIKISQLYHSTKLKNWPFSKALFICLVSVHFLTITNPMRLFIVTCAKRPDSHMFFELVNLVEVIIDIFFFTVLSSDKMQNKYISQIHNWYFLLFGTLVEFHYIFNARQFCTSYKTSKLNAMITAFLHNFEVNIWISNSA